MGLVDQPARQLEVARGTIGVACAQFARRIELQGDTGQPLLQAVMEFLGQARALFEHAFEMEFVFLAAVIWR